MIRPDNETTRIEASRIIKHGGVIAFRTDTFYGLGADPFNADAVRRVSELKGRDGKPILLVISDRREVQRFVVSESSSFTLAADTFWPAPLTLIGAAVSALPSEVTAASGTVGLRVPDDEAVRELVRACGGALTATSANPSGAEPAVSAQQVADYFSSSVDLIIDGGRASISKPSTVLDVSTPAPRIIREGAISREILERTFATKLLNY